MEELKAPEKVYLANTECRTLEGWHRKPFAINGVECVEYTRTSAFRKKAKEAFCKATCNGCPPRSTCTSLGTCREYDNFVKFLKEE